MEIDDAALVLHNHLAIVQGYFAGQLAAGLDHSPICPRPVMAIAGKSVDLAVIDDDQGAIAVILDPMKPASPGWRLRDRGWNFELDDS